MTRISSSNSRHFKHRASKLRARFLWGSFAGASTIAGILYSTHNEYKWTAFAFACAGFISLPLAIRQSAINNCLTKVVVNWFFTVALLVAMLLCILILPKAQSPVQNPPAFVVSSGTVFFDMGDNGFWFVHRGQLNSQSNKFEFVKAQIGCVAFLRLSNLRDFPLEIASYSMEARTNAISMTSPPIDVRDGGVYFVGKTFKDAVLFDFSTNNLTAVFQAPIPPHRTVSGWVFFQHLAVPESLIFHIKDMAGNDLTAPVSRQKNLDIDVQQDSVVKPASLHRDISQYQIESYADHPL